MGRLWAARPQSAGRQPPKRARASRVTIAITAPLAAKFCNAITRCSGKAAAIRLPE